jgi:NAD-dependent DNA ligase
MEQSSEQRANNLLKQLEDERATSRQLNQDLLRTQAELQVAQERLDDALTQVAKVQPQPDQETSAQAADGQIILVDDAAGIVHINLGSDDHIYRGLTFSVYDKASGVPRDGKPKAEVEIFSIAKTTSIARVLSSQPRNPIATEDIVANLIWDADKVNQFVITGDYDLNNDGKPDYNAHDAIQALIEKWGGTVSDTVSAKTDYVIIGTKPVLPPEPTLEILAADPTAQERYNAAQSRLQEYNTVQSQAQALYIPIFTYERFLYVIGYESQVGKAGAF